MFEAFLKSFTFSVLLFLVWGFFSVSRLWTLLAEFGWIELLWFVYNVMIAILFLIRVKPSMVSMNLIHWAVALITSFSGFLFLRKDATDGLSSLFADSFVVLGIVSAVVTACALGRSYDFLPALRIVKTGSLYKFVRHPMYTSSMLIKLGYVLKSPCLYNACILIAVVVLYDQRARYEESIMSNSEAYAGYMRLVKYRFLPAIY